jgi:type IV pilus assembly protein PilZ
MGSDEQGGGTPQARVDVRAPIELKVEYKKLNTFFADYTKNISKGGTFIKTDRPLRIGTEFIFKLFVPQRSEPFTLRGIVVWIHTREMPPPVHIQPPPERGMGIRFLYSDDGQKRAFEGVVEALIRESLGELLYRKLMERARSV